jgi:hypothetical protein
MVARVTSLTATHEHGGDAPLTKVRPGASTYSHPRILSSALYESHPYFILV